MGVTVREALGIGGLNKAKLLAGSKGLDRIVEYVSVVETPSTGRWLKGEELLISSFYAMQQNVDDQIRVLEAMHNADSSALVICYPEIWGGISPLLLQKADEYAIPLLSVPEDVSYSDIIAPLSRKIAQIRVERLEFINNLHNIFSDIVMQGKELDFFANRLSHLIQLPLALLDSRLKPRLAEGISGKLEFEPDIDFVVHQLKNKESFECIVKDSEQAYLATMYPVKLGNKLEGVICILSQEEELREYAKIAGEQAAIIYGWYILKDKSIKEAINRESRDFLEILLNNIGISEETLMLHANYIGLNVNTSHAVVIFNFGDVIKNCGIRKYSKIQEKCVSLIYENFLYKYPKSLVIPIGENIVAILSVPDGHFTCPKDEIKADIKRINKRIKTSEGTCLTGIGRIYPLLSNIRQSYKEAEVTIKLSKVIPYNPSIIHIDEVEDYALLFEISDLAPRILKQTMSELDNLIIFDRENNTDFFETLKALFLSNQNTNKAADMLFVHRNTIVYRKEKLKSLLTKDPFAEENMFSYELAIRLFAINQLKNQ